MLCWKNSEHCPLFASSGQEMTMNCTVDEDCVCSEDVYESVGRGGGRVKEEVEQARQALTYQVFKLITKTTIHIRLAKQLQKHKM